MRLVHLADLHLGFRQYERLAANGLNQRESDVAAAFTRAIDLTITLSPGIVVIAGDVFHAVRPSTPAVCHAVQELSRLRRALPDSVVVIVAGNHDTPRSAETGCMLRVFPSLGVHVADASARRFDFPDRDLSILAVPESVRQRPDFSPNPRAATNVLLTHLAVTDVCPVSANALGLSASIEELGPERWDYVAVGHYHVYRELAPNASYAGSIDYTSTDQWGELAEQARRGIDGKGIVSFDLETGERIFHPIGSPRALVDLPPIAAQGMSTQALDAAIQAQAATAPDGAIVRQIIQDVSRERVRDLDYRAIRALKRRCVHYQLDARRRDLTRTAGAASPARRLSLTEMLEEHLSRRIIESGISRDDLVALGKRYLDEAEVHESRRGLDAMVDEGVARQEVA